jgi:hypothetical protein
MTKTVSTLRGELLYGVHINKKGVNQRRALGLAMGAPSGV